MHWQRHIAVLCLLAPHHIPVPVFPEWDQADMGTTQFFSIRLNSVSESFDSDLTHDSQWLSKIDSNQLTTENGFLEFDLNRLMTQMAFQNFDSNQLMTQKTFQNFCSNRLMTTKNLEY